MRQKERELLTPEEHARVSAALERIFQEDYRKLCIYACNFLRKNGYTEDKVKREAEEIVQNTFERVIKIGRDFLNSGCSLGFVMGTEKNLCQEFKRAERTWQDHMKRLAESIHGPEDVAEDMELRMEIVSVLGEEGYKLLKDLYVEGYSYEDICGVMQISKSNLGNRVRRLKDKYIKAHIQANETV